MFRWWLGCMVACLSSTAVAEVLHVGFGTHKPPYVFEGEPRGLEYDIVERAARNAGFAVTAYYAPLERLHLMLRRGDIDAIATTHERSGVEAFYSDVYIHYHNAVVALAGRGYRIERVADLGQYSVSAFRRARFLLDPEFERMAMNNPRYRRSTATACCTADASIWWWVTRGSFNTSIVMWTIRSTSASRWPGSNSLQQRLTAWAFGATTSVSVSMKGCACSEKVASTGVSNSVIAQAET